MCIYNSHCVFLNTKLLVGSQENKTTASLSTPVNSEQVYSFIDQCVMSFHLYILLEAINPFLSFILVVMS